MADAVELAPGSPAYGRFSPRMRAFVIDWIIMLLLLVGALLVAIAANSDRIGRILGFTLVGIFLLYEPLLVSLAGSTVGHYLTNLRVVDDRTQGNVGLPKAAARLMIKTLLGIYSFITMATTSRHQAVHDLMTRSTVQIRDRSKASSHHYVAERTELLSAGMPSRLRRVLVISAYVLALFILYAVALPAFLAVTGIVPDTCMLTARCSQSEYVAKAATGVLELVILALCIVQGWRGRLLGCRVHRQNP